MDNDLVSIVTPMFNSESTIKETIKSVQAQSYQKWEMLIVDDCSTDASVKCVEQFMATDDRIRLIQNPENRGISYARNTAIGQARGRYIAFLDSDDLWKSEKLQKQILFMQQNKVGFSHTACEVIDESGQGIGKQRHVPLKADYEAILKGNVINCLTVVVDREMFGNPIMPNIHHEDYACWLELLKNGDFAWGIDEVLAEYREAGRSVSGNKRRAALWQWKIYREYLGLDYIKSVWCFVNYMVNAFRKRM